MRQSITPGDQKASTGEEDAGGAHLPIAAMESADVRTEAEHAVRQSSTTLPPQKPQEADEDDLNNVTHIPQPHHLRPPTSDGAPFPLDSADPQERPHTASPHIAAQSMSIADYKQYVAVARRQQQQERDGRLSTPPPRSVVRHLESSEGKKSPSQVGRQTTRTGQPRPTSNAAGLTPIRRRSRTPPGDCLLPLQGSTVREVMHRLTGRQPDNTPTEFSFEVYRDLHQRQFASSHEELSFLRVDFVSSRKTLAVLYNDTKRLRGELQAKVAQVVELEALVATLRHRGDPGGSGRVSDGGRSLSPDGHAVGEAPDTVHDAEKALRQGTAAASSSALWLFAATAKADRRGRGLDGSEPKAEQLINELRRNLARRDTALEQSNMERGALSKAREALERELRTVQQELKQTAAERLAVYAQLDEKSAALLAAEDAIRASETQLQKVKEELAVCRAKCELHDLLRGGAPAIASGDSVSDGRELSYMQEQVRTYRDKWQAAEDRIDQLLRDAGAQSQQCHTGSAVTLTSSPTLVSVLSDAQQARYEHELRDHAEACQRLQRQLQREQESSSFKEEQQRQRQYEEQRLHHVELNVLREQLQTAKSQLTLESQEKEALVRQLRHTTNSEAMTDTLQDQTRSLKQRLTEVVTELAHVRGRERELEATVQREIAERIRLDRENQSLYHQHKQREVLERQLSDEVATLRQRLGMEDGRRYAIEQVALIQNGNTAPPQPTATVTTQHAPVSVGGAPPLAVTTASRKLSEVTPTDSQSLASELKGYAALMTVNAAQQERIASLEAELYKVPAFLEPAAGGHTEPAGTPKGSLPLMHLDAASAGGGHRSSLAVDVGQLRRELQTARRGYHSLLQRWVTLQAENQSMVADNLLLADGAVALHGELMALRASASMASTQQRKGAERPTGNTPAGNEPRRENFWCPGQGEDLSPRSRVRQRLRSAQTFGATEKSGVTPAEAAQHHMQKLEADLRQAKQCIRLVKDDQRQVQPRPMATDAVKPTTRKGKKMRVETAVVTTTAATPGPAAMPLFDDITHNALRAEAERLDTMISVMRCQLETVTRERDTWRAVAEAASSGHPSFSVRIEAKERP